MLDEHRTLNVPTVSGDKVELEVNFNEKVSGCKVVRMLYNSEEFDVKKDDLMSAMLVLGSLEDQKKLIPMKLTRIRKMERLLTFEFKAKKPYREGETIRVQAPWIDEVPDVEETMANEIAKKLKRNK